MLKKLLDLVWTLVNAFGLAASGALLLRESARTTGRIAFIVCVASYAGHCSYAYWRGIRDATEIAKKQMDELMEHAKLQMRRLAGR